MIQESIPKRFYGRRYSIKSWIDADTVQYFEISARICSLDEWVHEGRHICRCLLFIMQLRFRLHYSSSIYLRRLRMYLFFISHYRAVYIFLNRPMSFEKSVSWCSRCRQRSPCELISEFKISLSIRRILFFTFRHSSLLQGQSISSAQQHTGWLWDVRAMTPKTKVCVCVCVCVSVYPCPSVREPGSFALPLSPVAI